MWIPTQSQVAAAGRHVLSYSMGAVTALAALHLIGAGDATTISTSINQISDGVAQIAAGVAPLLTIAAGWYAAWTASHKQQIASVNAIDGVKVVADTSKSVQVSAVPSAP